MGQQRQVQCKSTDRQTLRDERENYSVTKPDVYHTITRYRILTGGKLTPAAAVGAKKRPRGRPSPFVLRGATIDLNRSQLQRTFLTGTGKQGPRRRPMKRMIQNKLYPTVYPIYKYKSRTFLNDPLWDDALGNMHDKGNVCFDKQCLY
jgi:hypothetical protein